MNRRLSPLATDLSSHEDGCQECPPRKKMRRDESRYWTQVDQLNHKGIVACRSAQFDEAVALFFQALRLIDRSIRDARFPNRIKNGASKGSGEGGNSEDDVFSTMTDMKAEDHTHYDGTTSRQNPLLAEFDEDLSVANLSCDNAFDMDAVEGEQRQSIEGIAAFSSTIDHPKYAPTGRTTSTFQKVDSVLVPSDPSAASSDGEDPSYCIEQHSSCHPSLSSSPPQTLSTAEESRSRPSSPESWTNLRIPRCSASESLDASFDMYTAPKALPKANSSSSCLLTATILYNAALAQACSGDFKQSASTFEESLARAVMDDHDQSEQNAAPAGFDAPASRHPYGCCSATSTPPIVFHIQILHNIGYCYARLGKHSESIRYLRQTLLYWQHQQLLRPGHQSEAIDTAIAVSLNCLGVVYMYDCGRSNSNCIKKNHLTMAICLLEGSLQLFRRNQHGTGPEKTSGGKVLSKQVYTVLSNIGRAYYLYAEYERALHFLNEAWDIGIQLHGETSIDLVATAYIKGQAHRQLCQPDQALHCFCQILDVAHKSQSDPQRTKDAVLALEHGCIVEARQKRECSDDTKSSHHLLKVLYRALLEIQSDSDVITSILNTLGDQCYGMGDDESALFFYTKALELEQKAFDPNHPRILTTMTNIALLYKRLGDYPNALDFYHRIYTHQLRVHGATSMEVAQSLSYLGLIQYHMRAYNAAIESYQRALTIRRDLFVDHDENLGIAANLNSMGLVLFKKSMFKQALQCFAEALRIRRKLLGNDHRDVAISWFNIATVFYEEGLDELALPFYNETVRIERIALGDDHPDVAVTLQHIGQVYRHLGELEEAIFHLVDALAIQRLNPRANKKSIAKLLNQIGNIHLQTGNAEEMMTSFSEAARLFESIGDRSDSLVIAGHILYSISKTNPLCAAVA